MNYLKDKILVTGGTGLVGTALVKRLHALGCNVISSGLTRGTLKCNLTNSNEVNGLFDSAKPEIVIHLAAKVGGIHANMTGKADFYMQNTLINTNVMRAVQERTTPYIMAMGTGCAYPKRLEGKELFEEDYLDGIPEVTNDAYAYSKRNLLVNLQACAEQYDQKYSYCILSNIFGENDNFDLLSSHVVPALIRKFVEAERSKSDSVEIWGTGNAGRNFVYIEDVVDAFILILQNASQGPINIASSEITYIDALAYAIKEIVNFKGYITHSSKFPDGQTVRYFNIDKIEDLGWKVNHTLVEGLTKTINWYKENY